MGQGQMRRNEAGYQAVRGKSQEAPCGKQRLLLLLVPILNSYRDAGFLFCRSGLRWDIISSAVSLIAHLLGAQSSFLSFPFIFPSSYHLQY